MVVGWLRISLRLEGVRSLKEKRHLIRGALGRLGKEPQFAVAEVGDQDLWGNAEIGVSAVGNNAALVESLLQHAESLFGDDPNVDVVGIERGIERL